MRLVRPIEGLKLVILDCPYDSWEQPGTQELFGKLVQMKKAGYSPYYPYGALPVDTSDFVGRHRLICKDVEGKLIPVAGFRGISLDRCEVHRIAFPAIAKCRGSNATVHEKAVFKILSRAKEEGRQINYEGSMTLDPEVHKSPEFTGLFKNLVGGILHCDMRDANISELVCTAVMRLKVNKYFTALGFLPVLGEGGDELPPFGAAHLRGEPIMLMRTTKFADSIIRFAEEEMRFFWNARLEIEDKSGLAEFAKAVRSVA